MKAIKQLKQNFLIYFTIFALLILVSACNPKKTASTHSFKLLAINDVYRAEGLDKGTIGGLARVRTLREKLIAEGDEVLLLHAGDFLQPSFSSRINHGAAMIDVMNKLDGISPGFDENMIITFGNHEFDKTDMKYLPRLQQRIDESEFTWLDSNINWFRDEKFGMIHSKKLKKWLIKDIGGIKVGLFSLTTDMVNPDYIASFDNPIEVTKHYVPFLKSKGAQIVIALTHQQLNDDKNLLRLDEQYRPDLIFGGHEHYRQLEQINNKWIIKADADALSAAVIDISIQADGGINVFPVFVDLDKTIEKDTYLQQEIENWTQKTSVIYCQKIKQESGCLEEAYGSTKVKLIAEESEIRRFETNIGNYIADTARQEFKICAADIALINSGSIRLNHNISANSNITRKHIEGMFPYPSNLQLIEINGKTLRQMLTHTIDKWTANGHWLLVSGIRYTHNPEKQTFGQLRWDHNNQPILDNETFTVVVPKYLIDKDTDHDGYQMIDESMIKKCVKNGSDLKQLTITRIKNTPNGINPIIDGRICNSLRSNCN